MSVLDVIDPEDCDERGVPLDWERCRTCGGTTYVQGREVGTGENKTHLLLPCPRCDGFGSLKATALDVKKVPLRDWREQPIIPRCEDCGHPMSEGTWEVEPGFEGGEAMCLHDAEMHLRHGHEPPVAHCVHFSRCDEGCRHDLERGRDRIDIDHGGEASWRIVEVRALGWPHDLRPHKLAALCLRCYVDRATLVA